jgi:hypothetical protein
MGIGSPHILGRLTLRCRPGERMEEAKVALGPFPFPFPLPFPLPKKCADMGVGVLPPVPCAPPCPCVCAMPKGVVEG